MYKNFLRNNGLLIAIFGLFLLFLSLESVAGYFSYNSDLRDHHRAPISYGAFLVTGRFIEQTTENWESEFLEMGAYIVLTSFLFQRGSAESKPPDRPSAVDRPPSRSRGSKVPWPVRRGGWVLKLYERSLSIAFLLLFLLAFSAHAISGWKDQNADRAMHGLPPQRLYEFAFGSDFWFQSLQNWQSEFFGLGSMIILSIYLRQRGSKESKPVDAPHDETGDD